jgi:predicted permease
MHPPDVVPVARAGWIRRTAGGCGRDLLYSWRTLRRTPAFTTLAVLVLALGIGINTAVFTLVNVLIFRPLPVSQPDELAFIYTPQDFHVAIPLYRDYLEFQQSQDVFTGVLARGGDRTRIIRGAESQMVFGEIVSANYFDVLGVKAKLGRTFSNEEGTSAASAPVVVISASLWRSMFSSDPGVLGRTVDVEIGRTGASAYNPTKKYTIIGVMPPGFSGLSASWEPADYWVPLVQRAPDRYVDVPLTTPGRPADPIANAPISMVGRLRPDATFPDAAVATATIGDQLRREHYAEYVNGSHFGTFKLVLEAQPRIRLPFDTLGTVVPEHFALAISAVSACLLVVAIGNLVGLLRARGVARESEVSIRLTLGASRWRVSRQMLTESLLLAAAGGILGLLSSCGMTQFVLLNTPSAYGGYQIHRLALDLPFDWHVLGFSVAASVVCGLVTGLAPARQAAAASLLGGLTVASMSSSRRSRRRLRHWIVVPQLAMSLMLLIVGGSLLRGLLNAHSGRPGYRASGVVVLNFERPRAVPLFADSSMHALAAREAADEAANRHILEALPATGVRAASLITGASPLGLPLAAAMRWAVARQGFPGGKRWWISGAQVSPGYFAALGIPLRYGRNFDARDRADSPKVVIVCEALANWMWPNTNPVGQYLAFHPPDANYPPDWLEVIGVVGAVTPPLAARPMPAAYVPSDQSRGGASGIVARGTDPPAMMIRKLSEAIHMADATAVVSRARTMKDAEDEILFPRRFAVGLVGASGIAALVLAMLGLYGVMSFSVAQRLQEIGIRAALGATPGDLARLVLREGVVVALCGLGCGVPLAIGAARIGRNVVAALPPLDVATGAIVCASILAVVFAASYLPARRASRVDPMTVLRAQ